MNHASEPDRYACCHPLPPWGTADASCRAVGDVCEEGEENCVCEVEDGEDENHYTLEDPNDGGNGQSHSSPEEESSAAHDEPLVEDPGHDEDDADQPVARGLRAVR